MSRIGIFGGTFDPIHFGHLRPALELREALGLAHVAMIPCGIPPHRVDPVASAEQRWAMLDLALDGQRDLVADDRELRRPGPSYMVDTLGSFREASANEPLCLLLGSDAFLGLAGWHQWQQIIERAHIVVAHRPGWDGRSVESSQPLRRLLMQRLTQRAADLWERPAGLILFQPVTALEISATKIRELVGRGRSIRYLTPEPVRAYIEKEGLYRQTEQGT